MSLGRFAPNTRELAPETQQRVWRQHGYVAILIDDLPWDLQEMVKAYMTKRFGERQQEKAKA